MMANGRNEERVRREEDVRDNQRDDTRATPRPIDSLATDLSRRSAETAVRLATIRQESAVLQSLGSVLRLVRGFMAEGEAESKGRLKDLLSNERTFLDETRLAIPQGSISPLYEVAAAVSVYIGQFETASVKGYSDLAESSLDQALQAIRTFLGPEGGDEETSS